MTYKRNIHVSEVMISDLHTIDGLATVTDAVAIMQEHSISSLWSTREMRTMSRDSSTWSALPGGDCQESRAGPGTRL